MRFIYYNASSVTFFVRQLFQPKVVAFNVLILDESSFEKLSVILQKQQILEQ